MTKTVIISVTAKTGDASAKPYQTKKVARPMMSAASTSHCEATVGQHLGWRLRILCLLHQLDDLGERSVGSNFGGAVADEAALVDGCADHGVTGLLRNG